MTRRYGLYGQRCRDFLTYGGRVLVHSSELGDDRARAELAFLFPSATVREVPADFPAGQCLPIQHHPALAGTTFPLNRREFVHAS